MTKTFEIGRLSIDLNNDWHQLFGKYNWITTNFIKVYFEKENIHGTMELELYLLGFGIRFYWVWNEEMLLAKMEQYEKVIEDDNFVDLEDLK